MHGQSGVRVCKTRRPQASHFVRRVHWVLLVALIATGCSKSPPVWPKAGKTRVLVTFPALYCFVKNVAGDDADVRCLLTSQGPHDYSETPRDMEITRSADVIFLIGLELDEFVYKMLKR